MEPTPAWEQLTLPEFVRRYCRKPLTRGLKVAIKLPGRDGGPPARIADLRSESDVRLQRGVGPQAAAEIIACLKALGWKPVPKWRDVAFACSSAAMRLERMVARIRRVAAANPGLSSDLEPPLQQASRIKEELRELSRQMLDAQASTLLHARAQRGGEVDAGATPNG